jgi:hypothetical protein
MPISLGQKYLSLAEFTLFYRPKVNILELPIRVAYSHISLLLAVMSGFSKTNLPLLQLFRWWASIDQRYPWFQIPGQYQAISWILYQNSCFSKSSSLLLKIFFCVTNFDCIAKFSCVYIEPFFLFSFKFLIKRNIFCAHNLFRIF